MSWHLRSPLSRRAAMRAAALLAAGAGRAAGTWPPDPFAGSGCTCESFCKYECAINATAPGNTTFYRMTPPDVLSMDNKNSGDDAGDTSFVLKRRTEIAYCLQDPSMPFCKSVVINDTDNPDVILADVIEIDGQWGPYLFCNPLNTSNPQGPWNCTADMPGGSSMSGGSPMPWASNQCNGSFTGYEGLCYSTDVPEGNEHIFANTTRAQCCDIAVKEHAPEWTHSSRSNTCTIFVKGAELYHQSQDCFGAVLTKMLPPPPPPPPPACACERVFKSVGRQDTLTYYAGMSGMSADAVKAMFPAGGWWYSTPAAGECKDGRTVGDASGCTWRKVATTAKVAARCVYDQIDAAVVKLNQACFRACPHPTDAHSSCYLSCYRDATIAATKEQLTGPWHAAFASCVPAGPASMPY